MVPKYGPLWHILALGTRWYQWLNPQNRNLKKSFGGLKAVDVQSLNLNKNQLTSIIGPNGAGKTTFFDLISGFQDSDEGKVYLNKKNIL